MDLHLSHTCRVVVRTFANLVAASNNPILHFVAAFLLADTFLAAKLCKKARSLGKRRQACF